MDNGSPSKPDRTPAVTLTWPNVALLVGAIGGIISMGVYLRTMSDRQLDMQALQRENRQTLELIRSDIRDIRLQQEWLLRQSPRQAQP